MWCSDKYKEVYGDKATLTVVEGENHLISRRRDEVVRNTVDFFSNLFDNTPSYDSERLSELRRPFCG